MNPLMLRTRFAEDFFRAGSFPLPAAVSGTGVKARYENGIPTVNLRGETAGWTRKIAIA